MKITNVTYTNDKSGASIAVKRIDKMFKNFNYESQILTFKENKNTSFINLKYRNFFIKLLKKIIEKIFLIRNKHTINFGLLPSNFYKNINNTNSEITNLHWIGNEMISIKEISKINNFLIWTLHDMWPYSSIENYLDPKEFLKKYTFRNNNLHFFLKYIFKLKIKYFSKVRIVICTSRWQKEMASKSLIFKNAKKILIPLPLNFNLWTSKNKDFAKKNLNIAKDKKIVLFMLSHEYASTRKGLDFALQCLEETKRDDLVFITTNCNNLKIKNNKIQHININNLNTLDKKINLYSASDVFLMPSIIESFGQTVLEAQACNCPTVTFKNTGSEDIIEHLKTGYVSKYLDRNDFKKGIEWALTSTFEYNYIRNITKNKFSENHIIKKYKKIFDTLD